MKNIASILVLLVAVTVLITVAAPAGAQVFGLDEGFEEVDDFQDSSGVRRFASPRDFIESFLQIILGVVATVALVVLAFGGFMYITSSGDQDRAERAKRLILYAIIGLVIIGVSALVINIIINAFQG